MAKSKNVIVFQVCLNKHSTTTKKLLCDIDSSCENNSRHIAKIIHDHYKDKTPLGWDKFKEKEL